MSNIPMKLRNILVTKCEGCYVRNEEEKLVAVIGLKDVIVVNTKDGLLVCHKDNSQDVREAAELDKLLKGL